MTRPHLDPNRRTHKSEGGSNRVFEEAPIRKVQLHVPVGEENERGRGNCRLRQIKYLDALGHWHRGPFEIDFLKEPIHLTRPDTFAAFARDQLDLRPDLLNSGSV